MFKNKPVNHDPREFFIGELMARRGECNVFHAFYRPLVQRLFEEGVSRNVYCVNIDAVIAALSHDATQSDQALARRSVERLAWHGACDIHPSPRRSARPRRRQQEAR